MITKPPTLGDSSFSANSRHYIRQVIATGELLPGEPIDEVRIASVLGISRTPVREALKVLASEGLVVARRGGGFIVRRLSVEQLVQSYELRSVLEGYAAERAAEVMTEEDLWSLGQEVARWDFLMRSRKEGGASSGYDGEHDSHDFHRELVKASHNEFLAHAIDQLSVRPLAYRASTWATPAQRREIHDAHKSIYVALCESDGKLARRLVVEHLATTQAILLAGLKGNRKYIDMAEQG